MASARMSTRLSASAARVWELIGDFNALPNWHPAIAASQLETPGGSTLRRMTLKDGPTILERLEGTAEHEYRYSILEGPFPVTDYRSTLAVRDDGTGTSTVEWSGQFNPNGVSEADAVALFEGIYRAGLENLRTIFGAA